MKNKKIAAAIAAVFAHIKTYEEAAYYAMPPQEAVEQEIKDQMKHGFEKMNVWGFAGRSVQMQNRSMMQLRMFK